MLKLFVATFFFVAYAATPAMMEQVGESRTSQEVLAGSQSIGGPRLPVDVKEFGAKGDGVSDDTAAIQRAINFGCANNSATVYFPPPRAFYKVTQVQTEISMSAPVFNYPKSCSFHALGANSGNQRPQFGTSPSVSIVVDPGRSPNPAPVFSLSGYSALENLTIVGYNEAVYMGDHAFSRQNSASNIRLINVNTSVNGKTGIGNAQFPNAAEVYGGGIWYYHIGGSISSNSFTTPSFVILNDTSEQPPGIIDFEDLTLIGCGDARSITSQTGTAGNWMFRNVSPEDCNNGFLIIDDDGNASHHWTTISAITFDHTGVSDSTFPAFLKVNSGSATQVRGVTINNPIIAVANAALIEVCQGILRSVLAYGDGTGTAGVVTDCDGKITGPVTVANGTGFDVFDGSSLDTERTDLQQPGAAGAFRAFMPGNSNLESYAPIIIDARIGVGFGLPTSYGPDTSLYENSRGTLDIQVAKSFPPPAIKATPMAGGKVSPGTYEYWIASSTGNNCSQANISAPSSLSSIVVLDDRHNATSLSWRLPVKGSSTITGFCIFRTRGNPVWNSAAQLSSEYVPGASSTSYVDRGRLGCCSLLSPVPALRPVHRFTSTSLGVNNTDPTYNLDVGGTGRFTEQLTSSLATGTAPLSVASSTPVSTLTLSNHPKIYSCGSLPACSHKAITGSQIVFGSVILVPGSPSGTTVTGISPPFASSESYVCVATDATHGMNNLLQITNKSGSSFTITGRDAISDLINYQCVGN